jgi:hypothetical protein
MIKINTLSLLPPVAVAPKLSRAWNTVSLLPPVAMAPKLPRYGNPSVSPLALVPGLSVRARPGIVYYSHRGAKTLMNARNTWSLLPPVAGAPKFSRVWISWPLLPPVTMAPGCGPWQGCAVLTPCRLVHFPPSPRRIKTSLTTGVSILCFAKTRTGQETGF